jgi:hypothetical protein
MHGLQRNVTVGAYGLLLCATAEFNPLGLCTPLGLLQ